MTAPNQPARALRHPARDPGFLRLRMADTDLANRLAGAWWPRSRDLAGEVADLVDHFPADRLGRIVRMSVSAADWETQPRHVLVRQGYVKVGAVPEGDDHLVHLTTSDRALFKVLVVPSSFTPAQGQEALRLASSPENRLSPGDLLQHVVDHPVRDVPRNRTPGRP